MSEINTSTEWRLIETPFLDHHNDYIELVYCYDLNRDEFVVSDDGETIAEVEKSPVENIQITACRELLNATGKSNSNNELVFRGSNYNMVILEACRVIVSIYTAFGLMPTLGEGKSEKDKTISD